ATLAAVGLPGTNGFVGEFLILIGTFNGPAEGPWAWNFHSTMAVLAATGVVLGAVYMLWSYQRVFFGKITNPANANLRDMNTTEMAFSLPVVALIFLLGIAPSFFLNRTEPAVQQGLEKTLDDAGKIRDANIKRAQVRS